MPKIIDHAQHRTALATRAAPLFSQHGYSGLGMRQIAQELGISKSALYHYFPSKRDLFLACTRIVTHMPVPDAVMGDPVRALLQLAKAMEPGFASEMSLVFDYIRHKPAAEVAADPAMQLANEQLLASIAQIIGGGDAPAQAGQAAAILALITGTLMMRHFAGQSGSFDGMETALRAMLSLEPDLTI